MAELTPAEADILLRIPEAERPALVAEMRGNRAARRRAAKRIAKGLRVEFRPTPKAGAR